MTRQYDVSRSSEFSQKDADNWILQRSAVRELPAKTLTPQTETAAGDRSGITLDLMEIPVTNQDRPLVQPKLMVNSLQDPNQVSQLKEHQQNPVDRAGLDKQNNTGELPDNLKAGVENLSGMSMDDVRVHYNSSKPAQLNALAYTQGTDIHVGPGQERHLPHEAWHVVQQKQGRVQPTMQLQGMAVNDNSALEREADIRGKQASLFNDKGQKKAPELPEAESNITQTKQPLVETIPHKGKDEPVKHKSTGNAGKLPAQTDPTIQRTKIDSRKRGSTAVISGPSNKKGKLAFNDQRAIKTTMDFGPLDKYEGGTSAHGVVDPNDNLKGSSPSVAPKWWPKPGTEPYWTKHIVRGHLLNEKVGGPGNDLRNLTPLGKTANHDHEKQIEQHLKNDVKANEYVEYQVNVSSKKAAKSDFPNMPAHLQKAHLPAFADHIEVTMANFHPTQNKHINKIGPIKIKNKE
ncbi:DUF4157 domain-containing protein [Moorena producens]|uniref:eCIS core domain-containing protein n=1 Tax=Moorena producens TaxID=1155739 RepID=UPI003C78CC58